MRKFVAWLVVFLVGLLLGFVPQYVKARRLNEELTSCTAKVELAKVQRSAALTYLATTQLNYGVASSYAQAFFADAQNLQGSAADASVKESLAQIMAARDKITADLAKGSAEAVGELQPLVLKLEQAGQ